MFDKAATWDRIYREHNSSTSIWERQTPLLSLFSSCLKFESDVLDLGCGDGRNSLPLLNQGHRITAIDFSSIALERYKRFGDQEKSKLSLICCRVEEFQFKPLVFDGIICMGVLNCINSLPLKTMINRLQSATKLNGVNLISIFAESETAKDVLGFAETLFIDGEIKLLYSSWDILHYSCEDITHAHHASGDHTHRINRVVAVKREHST